MTWPQGVGWGREERDPGTGAAHAAVLTLRINRRLGSPELSLWRNKRKNPQT